MVLLALLALSGGCGEGGKIGLPAGFPADVPLPERGVLRSARDLGMKGLNVVFETEEDVRVVGASLGRRLIAAGWSATAEAAVDEAVFSSWRKGERSVAVGVSRSGRQTLVGISVVERPFNEWEGEQG